MPYLARLLASDSLLALRQRLAETKRRLLGRKPTLIIYIKADDPYSYLLLQVMPGFLQRFAVDVVYRVFIDTDPAMYPRADLWQQHCLKDATQLASLYSLQFPSDPPAHSSAAVQSLASTLARLADNGDFLSEALLHLHDFWFAHDATCTPLLTEAETQAAASLLTTNSHLLTRSGHYLGAMIHYDGVWYWGIDRLDHLEHRLNRSHLNKHDTQIQFDKTYRDFCQSPQPEARNRTDPIVLYWSARSPYSYLGLVQAARLSAHYRVPLEIKPVLPMMMRGMAVPQNKKMYIFHDTRREAKKRGIDYGFVADPLGTAVERCYALLRYARSEGKLTEYLLSFARAVNSEGIRADTDRGLKWIVERSGLDWVTAKQHLNDDSWRAETDQNVNAMLELGYWGVPTFCYRGQSYWGQDRIVFLEQQLRSDADR